MKKWISLMLALLLCFSMAACGGSSSETEPQIGATIDFDVPEMDFGGIEPYQPTMSDSTTPPIIEFDFDFSFAPYVREVKIENPVQIDLNGIEFEIAEYHVSIDESTFDPTQFIESSSDNFSQEDLDTISDMDTAAVIEIAEYRASLLAELSHAFQSSGLAVTVNENTGEIALDSAVLFAVDKSDISAEGATFLKQFLGVYTTVVFSEKYDGFVSSILVEGHTDTSGNYDYNLKLSQARADSVMDFCLSEESGIDQAYIDALSEILQAIGYSYDKPVYDANGNVDMDASRRVSFRFLIELP